MAQRTPWTTWAEWTTAYSCLYATDHASMRHGLQLLDTWRMRAPLPHAVASTYDLISLTVFSDDSRATQLALSAAIVRFVNGICDPLQKNQTAQSVASIASKLGLPPVLVDVRHKASHASLPSSFVLQTAARRALQWLQERYWSAQYESMRQFPTHLHVAVKEYIAGRSIQPIRDMVAHNDVLLLARLLLDEMCPVDKMLPLTRHFPSLKYHIAKLALQEPTRFKHLEALFDDNPAVQKCLKFGETLGFEGSFEPSVQKNDYRPTPQWTLCDDWTPAPLGMLAQPSESFLVSEQYGGAPVSTRTRESNSSSSSSHAAGAPNGVDDATDDQEDVAMAADEEAQLHRRIRGPEFKVRLLTS